MLGSSSLFHLIVSVNVHLIFNAILLIAILNVLSVSVNKHFFLFLSTQTIENHTNHDAQKPDVDTKEVTDGIADTKVTDSDEEVLTRRPKNTKPAPKSDEEINTELRMCIKHPTVEFFLNQYILNYYYFFTTITFKIKYLINDGKNTGIFVIQ